VAFNDITSIPDFNKTGQLVQKLKLGDTNTQIHTDNTVISLAYLFLKEENRSVPHKESVDTFQIHPHTFHMPKSNGFLVSSPD
jgi:hypothetical protein